MVETCWPGEEIMSTTLENDRSSGLALLILLKSVVVFFVGVFPLPAAEPDELISGARQAKTDYRRAIERLADQNPDEANRIRSVLPPSESDRIYLPRLPLEFGAAKKGPVPFELCERYADDQFRRAKLAAEKNRGNLAMQLAITAVEANPDHEEIRKLLGFKLYENRWRTRWEVERLQKGFVDHPVFGWIPEEHVRGYEAGERFVKNRWVSVDEEAELRANINNGWEVDTEHYYLRTNHSLEEGVRLSRRLEHLYRAWKLLFFRYQLSDETLSKMFKDGTTSGVPPRHRVRLYRNKEDYIANLRNIEPNTKNLELSGGYYHPGSRTAYFFPVDDTMDEFYAEYVRKTPYHEGTHQLFQETRLARSPGLTANFWLVEGIAMFMETFRIEENHYVIGDNSDVRLEAARRHKHEHNFYVPFERLVRFDRNSFQLYPEMQRLYSQTAGVTHFLMLAENGRYRDGVVQLLRLLYVGTDRFDSLVRLTGGSFQQLDEEYDRFLKAKQGR